MYNTDMSDVAKREYIVLGILIVVFAVSLFPALVYMRQERRDGVRRDEINALKTVLELKNNEIGYYSVTFDASPHEYVVMESDGKKAVSWFLRAELENTTDERQEKDLETNNYYRIVKEGKKTFYDVCGGEFRCDVRE